MLQQGALSAPEVHHQLHGFPGFDLKVVPVTPSHKVLN
jgi:hypothetical protein